MTDAQITLEVKNALGIIGTNAQDATIQRHIKSVKSEMSIAGVSDDVLNDDVSTGCIVQGVIDSWALTPGANKHSEMYKIKLTALVSESLRRAAND